MHRTTFALFTVTIAALLAGGCSASSPTETDASASGATTSTTSGSGGGGGSGGAGCEPAAETCDGVDNDCDGDVDEDCPCVEGETQSCYSGPAGTDGVGTCVAGKQTCDLAGVWGACVEEVIPVAEACNSLDDDCNGAADDMGQLTCGVGGCQATVDACTAGTPGTCVPSQPVSEICDGLDNDCDQLIDETFPESGMACDSGLLGACQAGTTQCLDVAGVTAPVCVANLAPITETCDSVDNDCNGSVDDAVPGTGSACSTGLLGTCGPGTVDCQGGVIDCYSISPPSAEICDGLDNDCTGVVDDLPGAGTACATGLLGVCGVGVNMCQGAAFGCVQQTQASVTDTCGDALDNDCDGQVDEGCLFTFTGVQTNLPIANLLGWSQCYLGGYGTTISLSTVLAQCSKAKLMMGCRTAGSQTLLVAAHAPRADVIFETGTTQTPHNSNGVGWYYTGSYSWGFAPQGSPINRSSCDIVDSATYPGGGASDGAQRICWHTNASSISSGWRCGKPDFLGSTYERLIYHAD